MTFSCDRCGAKYSSKQELREGRVYQARCQACGNSIRLTMASRPPIAVPKPSAPAPRSYDPAPRSASASTPSTERRSGELTPPPTDGYYDLVLDDSEPQNPKAESAGSGPPLAAQPAEPEPVASSGAAELARILARAEESAVRRRFGVAPMVAIAAGVVVIFGAVGAMALRRPQREEERVSRALLPRAEWATSATSGAAPSAEVLDQMEADQEEPAPVEAPAASRPHERTRPRLASRPVAAAAVASRAVSAERPAPVPAPPPAAAMAAAAPATAASAPAVAATSPAPPQQVEDAPQFVRHGFRSPAQEVPNCVQSSVRIPRDLEAFVSGPMTVRFAVDKDGSVGLFRVEGQVPDRRLSEAVWSAVRECRFVPGADEQGRPVRLWVVMPIRFVR